MLSNAHFQVPRLTYGECKSETIRERLKYLEYFVWRQAVELGEEDIVLSHFVLI